ncbi:MAG: hypothetical protein JXJ17_10995 [Anaerolineae bacterium]|nr:hypothetical protein [Anaerolineae bacterium]
MAFLIIPLVSISLIAWLWPERFMRFFRNLGAVDSKSDLGLSLWVTSKRWRTDRVYLDYARYLFPLIAIFFIVMWILSET